MISKNGVSVDPEKISAVLEWPLPKNVKALRGFSGLAGYHKRFVRNYDIIAPINIFDKKGCRPVEP